MNTAYSAEIERLEGWVDRMLTVGNHLALALIDLPHGWQKWSREEALTRLADTALHEIWTAWRVTMDISIARRQREGTTVRVQ